MDTDGKFALGVLQVSVRDSSEESNIGRLLAILFLSRLLAKLGMLNMGISDCEISMG